MSAVAEEGIELTEVPPEMWPTFSVVRGEEGSGRSAIAVSARLSKVGGLAGLIVVVTIFFMTYKPFL